MGSSVYLLSFYLLLLTIFITSTNQTLLLPLTHTLSRTQQTQLTQVEFQYHLLKTATLRSSARHHHRQRRHEVSLPLSSGSDYTLSFSVGFHHSQKVSLYMDTGSDLVWLPCSPFECILCDGKPTSVPLSTGPLNRSTPVPCTSPSCSAVHSSLPTSDLCAIAGCKLESIETDTSACSSSQCPSFYYAYGDGSLIASLRREHVSIPAASDAPIRVPNFTFGCAHTTLGEPIGVAGFGRGVLSLPAQISELSPHLGNRFSYCLVSHSFDTRRLLHPSPLILGRYDVGEPDTFVYTPMLDNPKRPYYYSVGLNAIYIGGTRITAGSALSTVDTAGNGGFVVDSGTTFTMLPAGIYLEVTAEFEKRMVRNGYSRATQVEEETGLSPCYFNGIGGGGGGGGGGGMVPSLVLHFAGNSSVVLPRRNYYMGMTHRGKQVGCLTLMNGGDEPESGPAGTLGNIQQQGFEVVYDLEGRRVGFARRQCASLWESISRVQSHV